MSTRSNQAENKLQEKESEIKHLELPKDGSVLVTSEPKVTEREIYEDRESIVQRLHATYLNLTEQMAEFQAQWDNGPTLAFINSAREGLNQGGASWLDDQAELFKASTWVEMGEKIKENAGTAYDRLGTYSGQRYRELQKELNKHVEHPEDTLYNWAWWRKSIEDEASELYQQQVDKLKNKVIAISGKAEMLLNTAETAKKIYKYRTSILNLPSLIATGDIRSIQAFVDKELMDIDPTLAKAIKQDPNFPVVLEIIADSDSALAYMSYVGLMMEAIPPNFYAYAAGKGAAYLMIEVVLLIVTALLSAGTAAAARTTMLVARIAASSVKIATVGNKIKRAKAAVDAFIRMLEDLSNAVDDLHQLGAKLVKARAKGLRVKGQSKMTLKAKKESIKRDKRCRLCGSTEHSTPRGRQGTVVYE